MRDYQLPGRSPVHAMSAMAATSHPAATLAALDMLRAGGNAVDAAITAAALLGVVEPQSTGIGGDCFCLYMPGGRGPVIAMNGSGRAPAAATTDWFAANGIGEIGFQSPHAVTVPGAVAAWQTLSDDYGRKGLAAALQPAIDAAENGYPVHEVIAHVWGQQVDKLYGCDNARRILLPGGRPPRTGEVHRQPELARTLRSIAKDGRDGFYTGWVADDIVSYLNSRGGVHTEDDFAQAAVDYVDPIHTDYRGYRIWECPPNGQGILVLMMLNILSGFDLASLDPMGPERFHLEAEVSRLVYRDRDALLADPAQADVPVAHLLSAEYAAGLRGLISTDKAMAPLPPPGGVAHSDTVYLTVVDKDRNVVSFINSLFQSFGCGLVAPQSGVTLHNRGASFRLDSAHPNCIAPGKRPMHTIIPGMVTRDGYAVMPFGVMGGHYQPVGQTHLLTNIFDYGLHVQEALDMPRAFAFGGMMQVERGVPAATVGGLAARGHQIVPADAALGGGQAIAIDWDTGVLTGGSEPRKDGCALGY